MLILINTKAVQDSARFLVAGYVPAVMAGSEQADDVPSFMLMHYVSAT
jgi:hypothetical protein